MSTTTEKTPVRKLTAMEKRASAYAEDLKRWDGGQIRMIWKKSSCYGYCPAIRHDGEKVAYASGCGYDKTSAALCEALAFLTPEAELHRASGAGVSSVIDRLKGHGWKLEHTYNGNTEDCFQLSRISD